MRKVSGHHQHDELRAASLIAGALLALACPVHALAWGSEGHRVVAEIAEQYVELATARQVRDLLATENATTLAEVSTWADQIRLQRSDTAPWHYVNIPIHPPTGTLAAYDPERDCPESKCVVAKIEQFRAMLHDERTPVGQRVEALKFLVHFVGDIHQPLHCANDNDHGGNAIAVEFNGQRTTLHAVWDSGILGPVVKGDERAYALELARSITAADTTEWGRRSTVDWANESYRIAATIVYGQLPHSSGSISESYEIAALPVVNGQLRKAGVRLAEVLNEALP
jgi:hypothetical protein